MPVELSMRSIYLYSQSVLGSISYASLRRLYAEMESLSSESSTCATHIRYAISFDDDNKNNLSPKWQNKNEGKWEHTKRWYLSDEHERWALSPGALHVCFVEKLMPQEYACGGGWCVGSKCFRHSDSRYVVRKSCSVQIRFTKNRKTLA